jgi:uncharacterized membrane protein YbhN (UPF0104 family)
VDRPPDSPLATVSQTVRWRGYARGPGTALTVGFLLLGAVLLWVNLRAVDWPAMAEAMRRMPVAGLVSAAVLTVASYATYCAFDLLGRRTTGHTLDRGRVLAIGFVSHACALSLGPAGAGVRFRLALHHGLPAHLIAALWLFNVATNWLGFMVVAGVALATRELSLPAGWGFGGDALQGVGIALLAAVAVYLALCRFGHALSFTVRGVEFRLPPLSVAALQCSLSALNWCLIAGVIHQLLDQRVPFAHVLGAVLASALALAIVDVPAGLGVTETVFMTLLGSQVASADLLAALMAYRAIYFVAPLALACVVFGLLEWDAHAGRAPRAAPPDTVIRPRRSPPARSRASRPDARPLPSRRSSSGSTRSPP